VPDVEEGLRAIARKLKPGAPLLLYLYYNFENRPSWFRALWSVSNLVRRFVSRTPFRSRVLISHSIAMFVYFPVARFGALLDRLGRLPSAWPLRMYRHASFYTMRTDALDRFGTRIEHRFSRDEIIGLLRRCGLENPVFSDGPIYWCVCARRTLD
jgi:hypothetical protein